MHGKSRGLYSLVRRPALGLPGEAPRQHGDD